MMLRYTLPCVFALSGCASPQPDVDIGAGYKVWAMSPKEKYISDKNDVLVFGPGVNRFALQDDRIIVCCEKDEHLAIDLKTGSAERLHEQHVQSFWGKGDELKWRPIHELYK